MWHVTMLFVPQSIGSVRVYQQPTTNHQPAAMISIQHVGVTSSENGKAILTDVSLTLSAASTAIIGRNGSGKSTFARLLNGLQLPRSGEVIIDGESTAASLPSVRRKVGFVFQNPDLQLVFPTVEEDLGFGLRNQGLDPTQVASRVSAVLERFELTHLRHHATHSLSGGEKQLVAVAGVLVMSPIIVVCDEPTTLLDLPNSRLIARLLLSLSQQLVLVTHDLALARQCKEVVWFEHGQVAYQGDSDTGISQYLESVG